MSPPPDRSGDRRTDRRSDSRSDRRPERRPEPDRTPRRLGTGAGGRPVARGSASFRPRRPGGAYGRDKPPFERESGGERGRERGGERSIGRGNERSSERGSERPRGAERSGPGERTGDNPYGRRPFEGRSARERRGNDRFPAARPSFGRPGSGRPGTGRRGPALFRDADRAPRTSQGRQSQDGPVSDGSDVDFRGDAAAFAAAAPSDLIWGRHSTQATLESGRPIHRVWCTPEMRFSGRFLQLLRDAKASGVLVEEVTWARLGQLTGGAVHQGIVLQPAAAETLDLASLIDGCRGIGEAPLLIAVDGLTDPQNLGAIVRSAEALGAHGMVLPQRRNAGLTGSVAKVAAGALEHLPVARVVNLNRSLDTLKQEGYRVVGLAEEGSVSLEEADLEGPLVVVTGSEGDGLSLLTRRSCDQLVRIPLRGATPSLNASVATALLLYEVARRGWMRGLRGAAPAPRIVRPSMPAPPDPDPPEQIEEVVVAEEIVVVEESLVGEETMVLEPCSEPSESPPEHGAESSEPAGLEQPAAEEELPSSEPAQAAPPASEPLPYPLSSPPGFHGDIRL